MGDYRVISSDSHVVEPPDLWTTRAQPKYRDRTPHMVRQEDGDWWHCDGMQLMSVHTGSQAGIRFGDPNLIREKHTSADVWEKVLPGGYVPEEHVKDMDADGVYGGVLYTSTGLAFYSKIRDSEFLTDTLRAYNDWLAEFCSPFPNRLKGIAMINLDEVQAGIQEMQRCANLGLAGVMIPVYPPEGRPYDSAEYEPFWAAAQDLEMPIGLHTGLNRPGPEETVERLGKPSFQVTRDHWARVSLTDMIASGVFERYPKLQVGSVEEEISWAIYFLERLDYIYTQRTRDDDWPLFKNDMLPSDFFHRNVFVSFQEDALGVENRDVIGVDNLLWGSDYPHRESTFPETQRILGEILEGCTEEEKAKISGANCAKIYHFN